MIFRSDKMELSIAIEDYEFPSSSDYWDANWLLVKLKIKSFDGFMDFKAIDPCLTSFELVQLKEWLSNINEGNTIASSILDFTEPTLSFAFDSGTIHIDLRYEFNPIVSYDNGVAKNLKEAFRVSFCIGKLNLVKLINQIGKAIQQFPEKNRIK